MVMISGDGLTGDLLKQIGLRFAYFGEEIYGAGKGVNSSPLYAALSLAIAHDTEMLRLVEDADQTTTITNLLFGAVHYLLLGDIRFPLADFYPDLTDAPLPIADAYPVFRAFCLEHEAEIRERVNTRLVQTNEVRRCSALLPAFKTIAARSDKPLALVEVGASAGLHLLWDKYAYDYDEAGQAGEDSPVQIAADVRGLNQPPIFGAMPEVTFRIGVDLNPIDVYDEASTRWLRALIWPEHADRRHLLEAALEVARQHNVRLVKGDASKDLPEVFTLVPEDAVLCVYHSYTLNQMPSHVREGILSAIADQSRQRDLYRVSQEWYDGQDLPHLELHTYRQGVSTGELLAYCESHGRWIEWLRSA